MRAWPLNVVFATILVGSLAAKERAADVGETIRARKGVILATGLGTIAEPPFYGVELHPAAATQIIRVVGRKTSDKMPR
jgi:hypothetical protein